MFPRAVLLLACAAGCSGDDASPDHGDDDQHLDTDADTDPQGMCGEVTYWDVTVTGRVRTPEGGAASGASVRIENREWEAGTVYGTGTTDAMGVFTIAASQMVLVEDCLGFLGHYAVAERDDDYGEAGINSAVFTAVDQGTFVADLSAVPIDLEEPTTP
jgi:hypothetical protein